jgi:hypothetical protein
VSLKSKVLTLAFGVLLILLNFGDNSALERDLRISVSTSAVFVSYLVALALISLEISPLFCTYR